MKRIHLTVIFFLLVQSVLPCSTFFINRNGQMVFGRNYDWVAGSGMVNTNQRGLLKTSFTVPDGRSISWTSRYGSITFNQYGKEFPTGGMNEKGLVVELMWLDETVYPKDGRPAVGVLQWIPYQLDNCSSIEEVMATDKLLRITATSTPLHYLVADAAGNAAAIEFLNGHMVVHKGSDLPFPVLTNSVYEQSVQYARQATQPVEGSGSLERFARACQMMQQYNGSTPLIDHSFDILHQVSQGSHTKWSIVYDITNRRVYFRTYAAPQIRTVPFSAFDFSCSVAPLCFNVNTQVKGDVADFFQPITPAINAQVLKESAELSKNEVQVTAAMQEAAVRYASLIGCK